MGKEDLSLDDIIKGRRNERFTKRFNQPQKQKFFAPKQTKRVTDARVLLNSKHTKVSDARERIKSKTPAVVDARQMLLRKKGIQSKTVAGKGRLSGRIGKIPKVTILNEKGLQSANTNNPSMSKISFHVTGGKRTMINPKKRINPERRALTSRLNTGIKIAVRNELALTKPPAVLQKKTFERIKITTVNKEAMQKKPSPPPPKQIRKRQLSPPVKEFEDEVYEDDQGGGKNFMIKRVKTNESSLKSLRPVQLQPTKKVIAAEKEPVAVGPSPIEGTKLKVFNLHPVVSEDDILELFSVLGAVRRARLVKPGEAEVVYIRHDNAVAAFKKYNNRDLDGQPMEIKFVETEITKPPIVYSWMNEVKSSRKKSEPGEVTELSGGVLQQALFKGGSTGTSTRPVVFTVKI